MHLGKDFLFPLEHFVDQRHGIIVVGNGRIQQHGLQQLVFGLFGISFDDQLVDRALLVDHSGHSRRQGLYGNGMDTVTVYHAGTFYAHVCHDAGDLALVKQVQRGDETV